MQCARSSASRHSTYTYNMQYHLFIVRLRRALTHTHTAFHTRCVWMFTLSRLPLYACIISLLMQPLAFTYYDFFVIAPRIHSATFCGCFSQNTVKLYRVSQSMELSFHILPYCRLFWCANIMNFKWDVTGSISLNINIDWIGFLLRLLHFSFLFSFCRVLYCFLVISPLDALKLSLVCIFRALLSGQLE